MPKSDRITKWPAVMLPKSRTASANGLTNLPITRSAPCAIDITVPPGAAEARGPREDRPHVALGAQLDEAGDLDDEEHQDRERRR